MAWPYIVLEGTGRISPKVLKTWIQLRTIGIALRQRERYEEREGVCVRVWCRYESEERRRDINEINILIYYIFSWSMTRCNGSS